MISRQNIPPKALYVHIPFCAKKCRYCDFNSIVSESGTVDRYLDALDKELHTLKSQYLFDTIYIGGGTPSLLNEHQLETLLTSVLRYIPSSGIKEYTVEANPGSLTQGKIRLLQEYSVNRISLGVQSFQERQLKFLGRIHSGNEARTSFALLRNAGFKNITIDLIFGCPDQSLRDWKEDLETVVELNPEHVSAYSLTYEDETPLKRDLQNGVIRKIEEGIELEMYKAAIGYFTQNGYHHYEISNFAKGGYECFHNCSYWENMSYVGVGAGAYSFIDGVRTSNEKDVFAYCNGIHGKRNAPSFCERLPLDHFASETIIMSLRLRRGISNSDFFERFGYKIEDRFRDTMDKLIKDGFISYENERLRLTDKGLFVADTVMSEFL